MASDIDSQNDTSFTDTVPTWSISDDSRLVQIRASKSEIERRISAFIAQKRSEVDDMNIQEFCSGLSQSDASCARVDAVFPARADSVSHLKVTRVMNMQGPQTRGLMRVSASECHKSSFHDLEHSVEERLHNMEQHLGLVADSKMDLFRRLKVLEERVLFLEGLSPEYFQFGPPQVKERKPGVHSVDIKSSSTGPLKQALQFRSLSEIDQRILELRKSLVKDER